LHHRSTSGLSSDNRVRHSNSPSMTYLREKIHEAALVVGALSEFLGRTIQRTHIQRPRNLLVRIHIVTFLEATRLDMVAGSDVDRRPGVRFPGALLADEAWRNAYAIIQMPYHTSVRPIISKIFRDPKSSFSHVDHPTRPKADLQPMMGSVVSHSVKAAAASTFLV